MMELRKYAFVLRKYLWLIAVIALVSGGLAYVLSRNSTPIYQATATIMVNQATSPTASGAYSDILSSERLARTYATLLVSRPVIEETAQRLGISSVGLAGQISVETLRETQLLRIRVEGPNPASTAATANTVCEVFIEQNQAVQVGRANESRVALEQEITNTQEDIAQTQAELDSATDDTQRSRLETSLTQYRTAYSSLVASYQQIKLSELQATNNVVLVERAVDPSFPIRPRTSLNTLISLILGVLIALAVVFVVDYLDDTIKTPDDVNRVCGLSTLGAIARLKETGNTRQLITSPEAQAPESEAYRTLRTNIQFSSVDKPLRTLLVTSSGPSEGKSTTAANLAAVMAQTGKRVVLVDTDLRRPVLHRVFGVPNSTGLTTALLSADDSGIDQHMQSTEIPNLFVLTSGPIPPNPSELLGSNRMVQLVRNLSEKADLVIFDSPPVLAVTDAAVLGRQLDGVLLVIDAGQTREAALQRAVAELGKTGTHLLGVALNRMDSRHSGYYYYYYYYYGEGEKEHRRHSGSKGGKQRLRMPWQHKAA